jgi:hypothetical protein
VVKSGTDILGTTSSPLKNATDLAPRLWFQSGVVTSTTKIKRKRTSGFTPKEVDHESLPNTELVILPLPHCAAPSRSDDDATLHNSASNRRAHSSLSTEHPTTPSPPRSREPSQAEQPDARLAQDPEPHGSTAVITPQVFHSRTTGNTSTISASDSPFEDEEEEVTADSIQVGDNSDTEAKPEPLRPSDVTMEQPPLDIHLPTSKQTSIEAPAKRTVSTSKKPYTMRQLARIALVAANGDRITASQMISWLTQKMSYLQVRKSGWEMQVRSCLSHYDEFCSSKMAGSQLKLYEFKDAETRAQFEAEYPEFSSTSKPKESPRPPEQGTPRVNQPPKPSQKQYKRAVKSAPTMPPAIVELHRVPQDISPHQQPATRAKEIKIDKSFMPFERSMPRKPINLLSSDHDIACYTESGYTMPPNPQVSIETMSEVEKAIKIAQIRARPSRKTFFGSQNRLAHKRQHNLDDIHDERDSAWKAPVTTAEESTARCMDIDVDDAGSRTLRQVFNLPTNMIPVNDGKTELAFKDGDKVGGRSARSRTIYKVGKMFGGELTVRTS